MNYKLRWQFPANAQVQPWGWPFAIQRVYPTERAHGSILDPETGSVMATFETTGPLFCRFIVNHEQGDGGFGTWTAEMSCSVGEEPPRPPTVKPPPGATTEEMIQPLRAAGLIWTLCYKTGSPPARDLLLRVLGDDDEIDRVFDGFVVVHFIRDARSFLEEIVATTLDALKAKEKLASDPAAKSRLLAEMTGSVDSIVSALTGKPFDPKDLEDGVPVLDARLASWVETISPKVARQARGAGRKAAAEKSHARWVKWLPGENAPPLRRLQFAALALWWERVVPQLERDKRQSPQAIVRPVYTSQAMLAHAKPRIEEDEKGQRMLPGIVEGGLSCRIVPQTDTSLVRRITAGLDKLGTLTGHRVLRWEIETGHRQFLEGTKRAGVDFRKIEVEGGYSEIARRIGVTSGDDVKSIREIIAAQDATIFEFPWANLGAGHTGRLLTLEEVGATRGRKAVVRLILGSMLVPGYASALNRSTVSSASRKLVPVTEIPPLVGSPDKYGAQVSLSMMLVLRLRDHAAELFQDGMVRLRPPDLQRMAREVGLDDDPKFLAMLWERWQSDSGKDVDDKTPAFVKCDGDRFTLADHHADARRAIIDAGAEEVAGRLRGQKGQAARAASRNRTLAKGEKKPS